MKKMTRIFFLIVFAVCLGGLPATAQETLTWEDCIREAQKNHPDLISAQEGVKQLEANKRITASALFPQITSTATATRTGTKRQAANAFAYGVNGSQLLFDGFKTVNNVKVAAENVKAGQYNYRFTSAQVRFRLRSAFVSLLRAQKNLEVVQEIVKIRRDNLALISLRYESGLEHKGALLTAQANLAEAVFESSQAHRSVEVAQRQLIKETGRTEFSPVMVKSDFTINPANLEKPDFEILAKNNPSLLQLIAQQNAAGLGITSAYANFFPQISAQGGAGQSGTHWPPGGREWDAGLSLSFPLFEGGLRTAQVDQAKAIFNQAQENKRSGKDNVVLVLEQTWASLSDAAENVDVQNKTLLATEERSRIAQAQYSVGFITYDNWSIIEDNLVQAKKAYLAAQANALLAEASWIQAKGETIEYAQ